MFVSILSLSGNLLSPTLLINKIYLPECILEKKTFNDNKGIFNLFTDYFSSVYYNSHPGQSGINPVINNVIHIPFESSNPYEISIDILRNAFENCESSTTSGPNNIHSIFFIDLCNKSLRDGYFPQN